MMPLNCTDSNEHANGNGIVLLECSNGRYESRPVPKISQLFYLLKPMIPRRLQLFLRSKIALRNRKRFEHVWPINEAAGRTPDGWPGWPEQKQFALVLSHDVDTQAGHDKCRQLMDLEEKLGFRSAFNFVPERYQVSRSLLDEVKARGFGLGVHGLKHDGKLFSSRTVFLKSATKINQYLADWGTRGFSSPSMLRNLAWMHELNVDYATSTFDTDPFEPQPDGIGTIFPFWVSTPEGKLGFLELPYTLPQDFTLFVLLKEQSIGTWAHKLDWIARHGGMALLNTHPDYMDYGKEKKLKECYPARYYEQFLEHVLKQFEGRYWSCLPSEVASFAARMKERA